MLSLSPKVGAHVVKSAMACVAKRDSMHYSQGANRWSGIAHSIHLPDVPPYSDCSSFTTWLMHNGRIAVRGAAGADIVNNLRWEAGYTGTQINHGTQHRTWLVGRRYWQPGRTLVFYGHPHDITHVAIYVGRRNGVEMVVSHGSEVGPLYLPWNYRSDYVQSRLYKL